MLRQEHPGVYGERMLDPHLLESLPQKCPRLWLVEKGHAAKGHHSEEESATRRSVATIVRHGQVCSSFVCTNLRRRATNERPAAWNVERHSREGGNPRKPLKSWIPAKSMRE